MKVIDPLAQSFFVDAESGIFVTSIDLFFNTKDENLPVTVQLRSMELGLPTQVVYPFSEVVLNPEDVNLSDDATVPTRVTFPSPVYLIGKRFHSIVVLSNSERYRVWVSKLGEFDVSQEAGESNQVLVAKQPLLGGLFKSQNASTWNESPYEDLKFTLYRANFNSTRGNFNFYNPELGVGNNQIATLLPDSLEFSSKKIRVGLGSTVQDSGLVLGNTVLQYGSSATGNYVDSAGTLTGDLGILNAGIGYTPSSGALTYNNVSLVSETGEGRNATADISISNGVAVAATINNGGTGYVVGDVLTVNQIGSTTLGRNLQLSSQTLGGINELILDNVQGDFAVGVGNTIRYTNSSGITTTLNESTGGNVTIETGGIQVITDGLNIKVNHKNHGMHAGENIVNISDVVTDTLPINLTAEYTSTSTDSILVDSTVGFETFENVGVSSTNPGYALIGNEIVAYEGVGANSLFDITRSIDQTNAFTYAQGTSVYKYELNGISLRRINIEHTLQDATVSDPIDLDYYNIKINTSQNGKTDPLPQGQVDRSVSTPFPKLYANETKSTGGNEIKATQNIQYEIVRPNIQTLALNGTSISARMRTVSGTSVDGNEISFADKGFDDINLNANNFFESPRIVASKKNEDERLDSLPGNKSLNLNVSMITTNSRVSPVVDLDRTSLILASNRVNNAITDYVNDNRVDSLTEDPSSFVYATKTIQLEVPASSIKLLFAGYINKFSDIRAFYAIQNDPSEDAIYSPFPGYSNLVDGSSDNELVKSDILGFSSNEITFKDYEYTVDNLPSFRYFSIKLVGSSTNQAFPPRLRDLRVIALA